jgi:hypothetical protein
VAQHRVRASGEAGSLSGEAGSLSGHELEVLTDTAVAIAASLMLAFHPDLVDMQATDRGLSSELETADPRRGRARFDRFVGSIVEQIRSQA